MLKEYLPLYMQGYLELNTIFNAEEPELNLLWNRTRQSLLNQYITTCNEEGIAHYESMMGITTTDVASLSSRIAKVLAKWMDFPPYTKKSLINRLKILCVDGDVDIEDDFASYKMRVLARVNQQAVLDAIKELLADIVPANIDYSIKLKASVFRCGTFKCGTKPRLSTLGNIMHISTNLDAVTITEIFDTTVSGTIRVGGKLYNSTTGDIVTEDVEVEVNRELEIVDVLISGESVSGVYPIKMNYGLSIGDSTETDDAVTSKHYQARLCGTFSSKS